MSQRRGTYAPEFRQQMVELVRYGRRAAELAKEFGCHDTSISAWVQINAAVIWMLLGIKSHLLYKNPFLDFPKPSFSRRRDSASALNSVIRQKLDDMAE